MWLNKFYSSFSELVEDNELTLKISVKSIIISETFIWKEFDDIGIRVVVVN